ncbi:hypothetical protein [Streptomyces tailanensis]|uniref:hypothetical protein n=1 Tax=Streptomyces tailanensis TaxID=2569858 RepID=UPI00122DF3E9|nr:hypothetical protein [Streptomyces tailanensis]
MTERPDGAPAQPQPQDQPSVPPAWPPRHPGAETQQPAQPPHQTPTQPQPPAPAPAQPQAHAQPQAQPTPSAYPYPNPQSPAGFGPPAAPIPHQQNPYGQPPTGYPLEPTPPLTGGGAGRAVLWAALGAVVASAAWAGGVFLLGDDTEADLRGYQAKANLCSSVDYSSFREEYPEEDTEPVDNALEHEALDQNYCSISLKTSSASTISDAYFSVQMDLHKKTDPGPEFTALWSEYDQRYDDYDVEKVTGFGDEAYLVTEDSSSGDDTSGSRSATLAVRDGWMTYEMRWSAYGSSYDDVSMAEVDEVVGWLKEDTTSTLENLKSIDGV